MHPISLGSPVPIGFSWSYSPPFLALTHDRRLESSSFLATRYQLNDRIYRNNNGFAAIVTSEWRITNGWNLIQGAIYVLANWQYWAVNWRIGNLLTTGKLDIAANFYFMQHSGVCSRTVGRLQRQKMQVPWNLGKYSWIIVVKTPSFLR